jgi:signal transduction histidine kinase/CheY-like chemotaxis protein
MEKLTNISTANNHFSQTNKSKPDNRENVHADISVQQLLIDNIAVGIMIVNPETKTIEAVNPTAAEMFGAETHQIIGKICHQFVCPAIEGCCPLCDLNQVVDNSDRVVINSKGEEIPVLKTVKRIIINGKEKLLESFVNISKQKHMQERAENSAKAKELFLTNMSHEIRTPLNVIIGMIREMGKEALSTTQKTYLKHSEASAYHLLSIINNVLDMSKIESGEFSLDIKDFSLSAVLSNVQSILTSRVAGKKIVFSVECSPEVTYALKGDSLRLSQVLINLLSNAIKFTDKGFVKLKVDVKEDTQTHQFLQFAVSDSGIGMSEEYLTKIFEKFTQESDQSTRHYEGSGLGMSISKEIIEMMGGNIHITSKKHVGTEISFDIIFPIGQTDKIINIDKTTKQYNIQGVKVLVVEDNEMNRFIARQSLKQAGCVVAEAENGIEAVEKATNEQYDVILMDIQMPEMDGVEATKQIRSKLGTGIPIVALTANAFKQDIDLYLSVGMNDYLIKPYKEEDLFYKIYSVNRDEINKQNENANAQSQQLSLFEETPFVTPLYNLDQLRLIAGDEGESFILTMVKMFVDLAQEALLQIKAAYEKDDVETIKKIAHKIKPSLENLNITILYHEIRELESFNKQTACSDYFDKLVVSVCDKLDMVTDELKRSFF